MCGATFSASKHADEFAFDYGETLDTITELNYENDLAKDMATQMTESIKQQYRPTTSTTTFTPNFVDEPSLSVLDGILLW